MIELFGSPTCHLCMKAKEYFAGKGVAYIEYNVLQDPVRKNEMVAATGLLGLPQIRINSNWYMGFDSGRLDEIIASLA